MQAVRYLTNGKCYVIYITVIIMVCILVYKLNSPTLFLPHILHTTSIKIKPLTVFYQNVRFCIFYSLLTLVGTIYIIAYLGLIYLLIRPRDNLHNTLPGVHLHNSASIITSNQNYLIFTCSLFTCVQDIHFNRR